MPQMQFTMSFVQGTYGWVETWFTPKTDSNLGAYYSRAVNLFQKRMLMCGAETVAQYIRLSFNDVRGDSLLFGVAAGTINPTVSEPSDAVTTCLLLECADTTRTYHKKVFARGIWDKAVGEGGKFNDLPAFRTVLNSYIGQLRADSWGWLANTKNTNLTLNINLVEQMTDGRVKITNVGGQVWDAGQWFKNIEVNVSNVLGSRTINGPVVLVPQSALISYTLKPIAILPYGGGGKISWGQKDIRLVDSVNVTRIGRRDTGRPILQPRGRQRNRIRG